MAKYLIEEQVIINYEVDATDEDHAKELWADELAKKTDTIHIEVEVKEIDELEEE
tara:strand:- start:223 stop:387 length:165 start_codon:yes stop_codon:yes gene_type:complete